MSKPYPNFQNKSYYDYIQFVKENDNFLEKIRVTKSIVDDQCPESFNYIKDSGKLHKYYIFLEKEKEKLRDNRIMLKKLSDIMSKRSSSNYLSNPYSTILQLENKNFMDDHFGKLNGKKYLKENLMLDKKIKMSKSIYAAETLERDFDKNLSYKKIISQKNNLYFESQKNVKTSLEFYSKKKSSDGSILPKLGKTDIVNPIIKTTSTHFLKNNIQERNDKYNKVLKVKSSEDLTENKASGLNPLISIKTISKNDSSSLVNEKLKNQLFSSQTTNNFKNSKDELLDNNNEYNNDAFGITTNLNNILADTNNLEQTNKELKIENGSAMISNLCELNILNDDKTINNQNPSEQNEMENSSNTKSKDNNKQQMQEEEIELENEKSEEDVYNGKLKDSNLVQEEKLIGNKEISIINEKSELLRIKNKGSAKTRIFKNNEDSFYNLYVDTKYNPNKSHHYLNINRILIDSYNSKSDKRFKNLDDLEKITNKAQEKVFDEKEAIEKMSKLEELELNDDLSLKEDDYIQKEQLNVNQDFENNVESELKKGDAEFTSLKSKRTIPDKNINDEFEDSNKSKLYSNKDMNNIENKILDVNVLTKNSSQEESKSKRYNDSDNNNNNNLNSSLNKNNNANLIISQKNKSQVGLQIESKTYLINENYSNYFEASNQNFYSNAININNNNNNNFINSNKNVLGSDNTGYTYNVFSLTTVNNFNSNYPNNIENGKFNQSPINENSKNSIEDKHKKPNKICKEEVNQSNYLPIRDENKNKPLKKIKNKSKEKHELFDSEEEDNYKNNFKRILYSAKTFMEKLHLVDVAVYMRNKMLFVEVSPISVFSQKVFIVCFEKKEDRQVISKIFKNYQSFISNLYFDLGKIEVLTRHPINYVI